MGIGAPLIGRLVLYDGLSGEQKMFRLAPEPDCPGCGARAKSEQQIHLTEALEVSCEGFPPTKTAYEVSPKWLQQATSESLCLLVDVRPDEEKFRDGVILGSTSLPLKDLADYFESAGEAYGKELVKEQISHILAQSSMKTIVFYCKTGPRSHRARSIVQTLLPELSPGRLKVLSGGIHGWVAEEANNQAISPGLPA
jgi:rhodanese-related sulfurtransferase